MPNSGIVFSADDLLPFVWYFWNIVRRNEDTLQRSKFTNKYSEKVNHIPSIKNAFNSKCSRSVYVFRSWNSEKKSKINKYKNGSPPPTEMKAGYRHIQDEEKPAHTCHIYTFRILKALAEVNEMELTCCKRWSAIKSRWLHESKPILYITKYGYFCRKRGYITTPLWKKFHWLSKYSRNKIAYEWLHAIATNYLWLMYSTQS